MATSVHLKKQCFCGKTNRTVTWWQRTFSRSEGAQQQYMLAQPPTTVRKKVREQNAGRRVGIGRREGAAILVTHALAPGVIPSRCCGATRFHVSTEPEKISQRIRLIDWFLPERTNVRHSMTMRRAASNGYVAIWAVGVHRCLPPRASADLFSSWDTGRAGRPRHVH